MTRNGDRSSRADVIADTAIALIAREGLRGLTHRAVDAAAQIPQGSTSYYAPTRDALVALAAGRLAQRSTDNSMAAVRDLQAAVPAGSSDRHRELATAATTLMDALSARPHDMRARYTLLLEFDHADPLHQELSSNSVVQMSAAASLELVLSRYEVTEPRQRARELIRLIDALVFSLTAAPTPTARDDAVATIEAYIRGTL